MGEARQGGALEIEDLGVLYGGRAALRGVTMTVGRGEITALVGPSGCGKTSLLRCLNRLSDLTAGCQVQGRVLLEGQDIRAPKVDVTALRRRVGMIFQRPAPFPTSIRRNFAFPLAEHGVRDRARVEEVMEQTLRAVGLWEELGGRLEGSAQALSGGQQQRLCIARALALEPEVLLLDEPCSALDPISSGVVEDLITSLRGRYTVVIVTHNLAQARRISDQTAFFWVEGGAGCLIERGPTAQIFAQPHQSLTAAYLQGLRG